MSRQRGGGPKIILAFYSHRNWGWPEHIRRTGIYDLSLLDCVRSIAFSSDRQAHSSSSSNLFVTVILIIIIVEAVR